MTPNPEPVAQADLVERLTGRARFCRDRGEIKTPELLERAAAELARLRAEIARKDEALREAMACLVAGDHHAARAEIRAALKEPNQ